MKSIVFLCCFLLSTAYSQELIPYKKGKLWGYCNSEKEILIEAQYKNVDFFHEGLAKVESVTAKKYGMINEQGEVVIPFEYESGNLGSCSQDRVFFVKDKLYGYYNSKGEVVIEPQFEFAYTFFHDHPKTPAKKDGKYGIISLSGETILPFEHPPISAISKLGYMTVYTTEGNGMMDMTGKIIVPTKFKEKKMHKKVQAPQLKQNFMSLHRKDGVKTRDYIFCNGEQLIYYNTPEIVDNDHFYERKYLLASIPKMGTMSSGSATRALIDENGNPILTWDDYPFVGDFTDNAVVVAKRKGNEIIYGLISSEGKTLIKPKYEEISRFDNEGIARFKLKGKYGFLNDNGEIVQEAKVFKNATELNFMRYGLMYYTNNDDHGIMDYPGNVIFKRTDNDKYFFYEYGTIRRVDKQTKKEQLYRLSGEAFTDLYDDISAKTYGFLIKENGKYGLLNHEGEEIIKVKYDKIFYSKNRGYSVKVDGKKGWLNLDGELILSPKYKEIKSIKGSNNFWIQNEHYDWQMIDHSGNLVNDRSYSELKYFGNGLYTVYKSNWGLVDQNGNEVVPLICRTPLKSFKSKHLLGVVKAGSAVYGYIGKDYTMYWD